MVVTIISLDRSVALKNWKQRIYSVNCGVSGDEEGTRYSHIMMPGGSTEAWPHLKPIFQAIAAKADGEPCCDWMDETGADHYVNMVHNGMEYGDM
jgi:6-phosphogluconate dehydrogenase